MWGQALAYHSDRVTGLRDASHSGLDAGLLRAEATGPGRKPWRSVSGWVVQFRREPGSVIH